MNKNMLALIGRILYGIPILVFGLFHFANAEGMSGMVPLPGEIFWVYLTGVALILAAVAILIGRMVKLTSFLLALLLLVFTVGVHVPQMMNAKMDMMVQMQMINILKNIALIGGALLIGAFYEGDEASST